jgi:hypothetical protein
MDEIINEPVVPFMENGMTKKPYLTAIVLYDNRKIKDPRCFVPSHLSTDREILEWMSDCILAHLSSKRKCKFTKQFTSYAVGRKVVYIDKDIKITES